MESNTDAEIKTLKSNVWWKSAWVRHSALAFAGILAPQLCSFVPGLGGTICGLVVRAAVLSFSSAPSTIDNVRQCEDGCNSVGGPAFDIVLRDGGFCRCSEVSP